MEPKKDLNQILVTGTKQPDWANKLIFLLHIIKWIVILALFGYLAYMLIGCNGGPALIETKKKKINVDNYPDGEALRTALQALSHEEELLLSMFVGARYEEIIPYRFSVVPETPDTGVLCYFSPQQGVSTAQRNGYDAISYLISTSYDGPTGRPDNNPHNLIYRTPVQCEVQVYSGSGLLQTKSLPFFQFGPYSIFPL